MKGSVEEGSKNVVHQVSVTVLNFNWHSKSVRCSVMFRLVSSSSCNSNGDIDWIQYIIKLCEDFMIFCFQICFAVASEFVRTFVHCVA